LAALFVLVGPIRGDKLVAKICTPESSTSFTSLRRSWPLPLCVGPTPGYGKRAGRKEPHITPAKGWWLFGGVQGPWDDGNLTLCFLDTYPPFPPPCFDSLPNGGTSGG
jgi:hypothetical protein